MADRRAKPPSVTPSRLELLEQLSAKLQASINLQVEILGLTNALAQHERESRAMAVLNMEASSAFIPAKEAARMAGVTVETVKTWAKAQGFGWRRKTAKDTEGPWKILRDDYVQFLKSRAAAKRKP